MSVDLTKLHPELARRIGRVLDAMRQAGHPMRITDGYRTVAQQAALFQQGRTTPGPKVTRCDGVRYPSPHQSGRAVDCCFAGDHPYSEAHPWALYGEKVRAEGLVWGGHFGTPDRPHCELTALPEGVVRA